MAITGSGTIKWSDLQTEFGGSNPISLSEYYRGGSYVGSTNTNVPTSGQIKISDFYGASAADLVPDALDWSNISVSNTGTSPFTTTGNGNTLTITGINTSITLAVNTTNWSTGVSGSGTPQVTSTIYIKKNGSNATSATVSTVASGQSRGMTVSVSNGDTIQFSVTTTGTKDTSSISATSTATWTVTNQSSGDTVLDTFTHSVTSNAS